MSTVAAPTVIVPLTIVVPLATAALLAGANRQLPATARDVLAVGAAAVTTALAAVALAMSAHGRIVYWFGGWHPVRGTVIGVDYVVDPMGGALAVLAGTLAVAALVYSRRFFESTGGRYPALVLVFVAASVDFAWTGDLFNMFVAFELVAVVGFVLTGYYAESEAPLQGAINFAVTNTFGGLVFLVGLALLYGHTGTLNMAQMGQSLAAHPAGGLVAAAFALLASGFLIKAAVVPWHFWLPDAYGTAPAPACVLFAGVLSELGLFGLARTWGTVFSGALSGPAEHRIRLILAAFGILTALVGTAMSLVETHFRRLLAFVVVAHMGLYLLGFSLLRTAALGGVALLAAADGLTKAALFLAAGVLHRHRRLTGGGPLAGQGAALAVAAGLVVLGALALADLPPFASSVGKGLLGAAAGAARSCRRSCLRRHRGGHQRRHPRSNRSSLARRGKRSSLARRGASGDPNRVRDPCAAGGAGPAAPRRTRTRRGTPPRRSRRRHRRHLRGQERVRRRRSGGTPRHRCHSNRAARDPRR